MFPILIWFIVQTIDKLVLFCFKIDDKVLRVLLLRVFKMAA